MIRHVEVGFRTLVLLVLVVLLPWCHMLYDVVKILLPPSTRAPLMTIPYLVFVTMLQFSFFCETFHLFFPILSPNNVKVFDFQKLKEMLYFFIFM